MNPKFVLIVFLALPLLALAKIEKPRKSPLHELEQVLTGYHRAPAIEADIVKHVVQETMGTKMDSKGHFYFSKGKMRLDMSEPDRTTLVYDGKNVWFESRLDEEHVSVTKMRANDLKKSDSIVASLFERKNVLKNFKFLGEKDEDGVKTYSFDARDKKKSDVQSLQIALKDKDLRSIAYSDQIENKVTLEFSDVSKGKLPAEKFTYKPPKGADVTEP